MASDFESDLRDTVGARSGLLISTRKTQLVLLDRSNNTGTIDAKMDGYVLAEKSSFRMLGFSFSSKLDWGSYISLLLKVPPKKLESPFIL